MGDRIEVHFDSGIRSGQDILKALALGAKGVMVGRAMVYGLGAMGRKGVCGSPAHSPARRTRIHHGAIGPHEHRRD